MSDTTEFEFLNKKFFENITKNRLNLSLNAFKVVSFKTSRATAIGENYLGALIRANVIVEVNNLEKEHHYVIKISAGDDLKGACISEEFKAYDKEMLVYQKLIPALEKIWNEAGRVVQIAPKCFGIFNDPVPIIVLEDLKPQGYEVGMKQLGFDLDHFKLVMEKMAQFHAASAVLYEKVNDIRPSFDELD